MKQTIEIDVPDGYEVCNQYQITPSNNGDNPDILITLKKKEPEYIEFRSYLYRDPITKKMMIEVAKYLDDEAIEYYEKSKGFIRWVDKEPRKIYIEEQA